MNGLILNIQKIKQIKEDIKQALSRRKVLIDDFTPFKNYADLIDDIEGGSLDIEVWKKPYEEAGAVVIPDGVEKLRNRSYIEDGTLTSISASTVKEVGGYAFSKCTNLTSVNMPELDTIGDYAFRGTSKLTNLILGNSFKSIGQYAFYEAHSTTFQASQFNNIEYVGTYALKLSLTNSYHSLNGNVVFNKNVSLGIQSFAQVMGNYTIKFTNGATIASEAFWNANGLKKVDLSNVTSIGQGAFLKAYYLDEVTFGSNITNIPKSCFEETTRLTTVNFAENSNTVVIGEKAFYKTSALENITLPDKVDLYSQCFAYSGLKSFTFPNSYTWYGNSHFNNCTNLTTVNNCNLNSIATQMFANCTSLQSINLPKCTTINSSAFVNSGLTHFETNKKIALASGAFQNCSELTWLGFPLGFTRVESGYSKSKIFSNCSKLRKIYIPSDSDLALGGQATSQIYFEGCSSDLIIYTDLETVPASWASKWNYISDTVQAQVVYGASYQDFKNAVNADEECIK